MGWPGRKAARSGVLKRRGGLADRTLGAAHVGNQVLGTENGSQLFHQVESGVDGHGQQGHLAVARRLQRIGCYGVDGAGGQRRLRSLCAAVPAHKGAVKARGAQRQAHRSAQQARAQNGDALDHCGFSFGSNLPGMGAALA